MGTTDISHNDAKSNQAMAGCGAGAQPVDGDPNSRDLEETRRICRDGAPMLDDPLRQTLDANATLLGVTLPLGTRLRYVTPAPP